MLGQIPVVPCTCPEISVFLCSQLFPGPTPGSGSGQMPRLRRGQLVERVNESSNTGCIKYLKNHQGGINQLDLLLISLLLTWYSCILILETSDEERKSKQENNVLVM